MMRALPAALVAALSMVMPAGSGAAQQVDERPPDPGLTEALSSFYAALGEEDGERAAGWLAPGFFYIAPWGELELADEMLARYREAFAAGRLRDYRVEVRAVHTGPVGERGLWFRAIVREKYLRESGRRARNAFAEDLLTSGVAVREGKGWRIRTLHQTWSDETLRRMVPILHAAQPVDPEEY